MPIVTGAVTPRSLVRLALLVALASPLAAQSTTTPQPAAPPPVDVSGVLFLTYQTGGTPTERRVSQANRFDVMRAYINVRAAAGDRMSMRITADVVQQRDSTRDQFHSGWVFRAKYAYAQYDYYTAANGLKAVARLGMLHTPIIEWEESFWPRGIANTAIEQNGFFSSADVGAATHVTLPSRMGEAYLAVLNGAGYTSRETDRFKDVGGRVSLTPLANGTSMLRTLSITPWALKGNRSSSFLRGQGTLNPVTEGRQKDRFGLHVGINDPRLMLAGQLAWKKDVEERADTTVATVPTVTKVTGQVLSAYTIVKPLAFIGGAPQWPIMALLRVDHIRPNTATDARVQQVIAGLGYELNRKARLWVDYQNQDPKNGATAADLKTLFVHAIVNFP